LHTSRTKVVKPDAALLSLRSFIQFFFVFVAYTWHVIVYSPG
jgi:hypothetical protein